MSQASENSSELLKEVEAARRAFRDKMVGYIKAGNRYHHPAPELPTSLVENCRFLGSRREIISRMPKNGIVAEVGVDKGEFSRVILEIAQPEHLHLIHMDLTRLDYQNVQDAVATGQCELHGGDPPEILSEFQDRYFDWIYIDGDHYYEAVKQDLEAAKSKLKAGGYLVFNDYSVWSPIGMTHCGVARAVNEFCLKEGWEFVYFSFQSMGYNDVAIRKV
ncbi:class I SAM-dependent methyltransferase [Pseudaminobacter sp. 19-2017]|uniref:Class I SAM-dependent methyltransferase n=1 Tax=Pseudaminobacter soli (ex Zhang et al. 2022) TaxID=2831468 RepID=A0A942DWF6_9HYPH|nr:class I SAM-dependent methyltransferase [Pseudaminobacter soli]MBS3648924.1 class I SAM-dependent methyltransferase [Pseudaminobacter soli]